MEQEKQIYRLTDEKDKEMDKALRKGLFFMQFKENLCFAQCLRINTKCYVFIRIM